MKYDIFPRLNYNQFLNEKFRLKKTKSIITFVL